MHSFFRTFQRCLVTATICGLFLQANGQDIFLKGKVIGPDLKPVASVEIKLLRSGLSDTTDANGVFRLARNTTSSFEHFNLNRYESIKGERGGLSIHLTEQQDVAYSIYTIAGKVAFRHRQHFLRGSSFVSWPPLSNGIYIAVIKTKSGSSSEQFVYTDGANARKTPKASFNQSTIESFADLGGGNTFVDTILINAESYEPYRRFTAAIDTTIVIKLNAKKPLLQIQCDQEPCDPEADPKVRNLLCYLKSNTFISGQTDIKDCDYVQSFTGRYPAICAFDFMDASYGRDKVSDAITWAQNKKGIIAYQWHWRAPVGDNYNSNYDFSADLTIPNSDLYKDIDEVMRQLKRVGDAGFPVIFRPLHEANNNYMWWAKKGSANYKKLWKLMYDRAQALEVHNLLWCFNGMANGQSTSLSEWYPGDEMVDIVSSDYYEDWNDYNTCKSIGYNKIVGVAETMNQLNPANDPPWSFSVVWASRDWNGNSVNDWKTAMSNQKTISIDQLPAMDRW